MTRHLTKGVAQNYLSIGSDAKTVKGETKGWMTGILYLKPSAKTCPYSTEGCRRSCLWTAGRGQMNCVQAARAKRTVDLYRNPQKFSRRLIKEIVAHSKNCFKKDMNCCVRLNGTSDLDWSPIIDYFRASKITPPMQMIRFYDYTKNFWKVVFNRQSRYYLVYSRHEHTKTWQLWLLKLLRKNSAVVFKGPMPKTYKGIRVVNGDESDLRFLDPKGVIVGLKAKGAAKKDTTGFVVHV